MRNAIRHSWGSVINVWFREKCPQGFLARIDVSCFCGKRVHWVGRMDLAIFGSFYTSY